jgi:uncharacterized protein
MVGHACLGGPGEVASWVNPELGCTSVIALIEQNRDALARLCRQFRVERLELFGSAAKGTFQPGSSDVDFLVTFADAQPGTYADRYLGLLLALEQLFQREIDLVTERSIRNPYFRKAVEATRQLVYDGRGEETAA